MRATSRAGSALAATTLAAFFAPGDAAEVTVKISYPDRDAGPTAARVLVATLVTLAVSVLVWMVLRRSASSTTRTSTSTTTAEQDVVNDNEEIDGNNGWEVLTGDDDEEDTTAGAPAVGGHGRSAEGQAGSSAASGERPAVARRAGGVRVVPWIKCSQCTAGYMYLECPRCGREVCRSCSSRCERCPKEECNHCGLSHDFRCRWRRVANGDAARGSDESSRFEGLDGAHRTQVINWAMIERRLDVKSAPWYSNHPPCPPGGDALAPLAVWAVSLGGQNPSEAIGPSDVAESPPPLESMSSSGADEACWSASTRSAAEVKAINQPIVSCVTRGGDSCSEGEADGSLSVWAGAPAVGGHGRSAEGQAGSSAASRERPAVARRAGEAARASARQVAPRLADSLRLDAIIVPLSPAEKWLEDFVMLFHRDALRTELKRRGHSPTGLKRQLACRLVRDGSANAVSTESIWRLAALEAVSRTGRESSGGHRASILAALETEQSLVSYLRSRE